MKFLHTADWHIGKRLHEYPLVKEQHDALAQIAQIAQKEQVDAVVVAGDLYDRSLPSEEAVTLVNQALRDLNLTADLPLLVISGNHDSAVRLATGQEWFKQTKLYLHTRLSEAFTPIEFEDTQFFLLPYFELQEARNYFADESISDLTSAMKLVVAKLKTKFDPAKKQVLVAHFFAAGSLRSRKGAPRCVQHPPPGARRRTAYRQQRPQRELQEHHHNHDLEHGLEPHSRKLRENDSREQDRDRGTDKDRGAGNAQTDNPPRVPQPYRRNYNVHPAQPHGNRRDSGPTDSLDTAHAATQFRYRAGSDTCRAQPSGRRRL